jgi:hypothetical protein
MTTFQIFVCMLMGTLMVLSLGAALRGTVPKRVVAAALVLWTFGVVAAVWPFTVSGAAQALGIGRGSDLILYLTTLSLAVAVVYSYVRFRRVERQLTLLVRRLAMEATAQRSPLSGAALRSSLPSMTPGASEPARRVESGSAPRLLT